MVMNRITTVAFFCCFLSACTVDPDGDPLEDGSQESDAGVDTTGLMDASNPTDDTNDSGDSGDSGDSDGEVGQENDNGVVECGEMESAAACAEGQNCSWLGTNGCHDSQTLVGDFPEYGEAITGLHEGSAYVENHEIIPSGAYWLSLASWEYGGAIQGSLYLAAAEDEVDFPQVAYSVTGEVRESGRMELMLGQPRCSDPDAEFDSLCEELAAYPDVRFRTTGGFEQFAPDGQIQISAFSRALPVGDLDEFPQDFEPGLRLPFIGMVLEPHGGFKPVEVPPPPRDNLDGEWAGTIQFFSSLPRLAKVGCSLTFSIVPGADLEGDASARLKRLDCGDDRFPTTDQLEDVEVAISANDDFDGEYYFSFVLDVDDYDFFFSGVLREGRQLSGFVGLSTEVVPNFEAIHPTEIDADEQIGVFIFESINGSVTE